ncbi:MAG TPA: hypothetical protein PLM57_02805, partial [Candidatus Latescibacteria bacterium]|nr:hypothetical protein [Candidatus Latescibacterota bacterium]
GTPAQVAAGGEARSDPGNAFAFQKRPRQRTPPRHDRHPWQSARASSNATPPIAQSFLRRQESIFRESL